MPRFIGPRRALTAVALSAAALVAAPSLAGAAAPKPHHTSFTLTPLAKFVPCMAADGVTPPTVTVDVARGRLNDTLTLNGKGFKPGLAFDLFTIEHSRLNAGGQLDPAFGGFGMSWYQSDLEANRKGRMSATVRTILLDQTFGLVDGGSTPVPPTNTFNVGFWFNNPDDAAGCGFTGATPFNGDHHAGPLAAVSRPDATTGLGPLCTSPESDGHGGFRCNP